jgi:Retrotransposon hot spot protein.
MRLQSSLINDDCLSTDDWQQYSVQFKVVDKSITAYDDMKHDVLYYPTDKSFPLVDMYYLDVEQNLIGIQATMDEKHPKSVTTYEKFYEKLKTSPECTKLHLYYLILPRYVDRYYREKGAYPLSQFWLGAKNGIDSKWKENINFYTLLPPDTFEASYPNDA